MNRFIDFLIGLVLLIFAVAYIFDWIEATNIQKQTLIGVIVLLAMNFIGWSRVK